jgi:CRISPR-associated protein Csb2
VAIGEGKVVPQTEALPLGKHYVPALGGGTEVLKTPGDGFVNDLERAYGAFRNRTLGKAVDADTRPRAYRPVPYRIADEPFGRLCVPFDLLDTQGEERQSYRCEDGMLISAWMRHAARQRFLLEGWDTARVNAYVSGHTSKGEENNRLSYVPLPSIGHTHSDARHRRAMVVLPFNDENADESLAILYRMAGDPLLALDSADPIAWLGKGDKTRDSVLERYLGKSADWLSVTPVILHGRDFDGGSFRPRKAEKLILQAFAESGYPIENIAEFSYQPAPYWRGPGSARQARVPKHLEKWPRYHVRVVFAAPVSGPVLVGIGRHYGLGVFAARSA